VAWLVPSWRAEGEGFGARPGCSMASSEPAAWKPCAFFMGPPLFGGSRRGGCTAAAWQVAVGRAFAFVLAVWVVF
jgi:hypothetical protein